MLKNHRLAVYTDNLSFAKRLLKSCSTKFSIIEYSYNTRVNKPGFKERVVLIFNNNDKLQHALITLHKTRYRKEI